MKFTLAIPLGVITPDEFQTPQAIGEMARTLERAGVDACYVTDHPIPDAKWLHAHGHDALDPFTALAFVAAASTSLRLHTNIVVLPYRNPFLTAKAAATLQQLSSGRLILGVGGGYQPGEFEALGVDFRERGALFDEALEVLRLAWRGGPVATKGRHFNATGNEPRPIPDPAPPIWIGGGSDKAIERAARWGDGWCPFFALPTLSPLNQRSGLTSLTDLSQKLVRLQTLRSAAGRTGTFDVCTGPPLPLTARIPSQAQEFLDTVGELASIGVTWTMADVRYRCRADYLDAVQWFGEEIVRPLASRAQIP